MNNTELIIARYKEDISWIQSIDSDIQITTYNKFYNDTNVLPNVGRESHTYLYHILKHYDNLSEYNIFCQGNPFEHCKNFLDLLRTDFRFSTRTLSEGFYCLSEIAVESPNANIDYRHQFGLPMYYILDLLFDIKFKPNDTYTTMYGGQFIVHKTNILTRPKIFYNFLFHILSFEINPIEGFILERLWPFIFNKNLKLSQKIIYLMNSFATNKDQT